MSRTNRIVDLCFFDGSRLAVTHRANVQALFSLEISLSEELGHDALGPLLVEMKRFGRVAEVSTVHHVLQNLSRDTSTANWTGESCCMASRNKPHM